MAFKRQIASLSVVIIAVCETSPALLRLYGIVRIRIAAPGTRKENLISGGTISS